MRPRIVPAGVCVVEELVADVDGSHVCAGAHAVPVLWLSGVRLRLWLTG